LDNVNKRGSYQTFIDMRRKQT